MTAYTLLPNDTNNVGDIVLTRIQRLKDGALGGYVQSEANLSQDGDCWLEYGSLAYEDARIIGNAQASGVFYGSASIRDNAIAHGNFYGSVQVYDRAQVYGEMYDTAQAYGNAIIRIGYMSGNSKAFGSAVVSASFMTDNASIYDNGQLYGSAAGNVIIKGTAKVYFAANGDTVYESGNYYS